MAENFSKFTALILAIVLILALTFIAFIALQPESKSLDMKISKYLSITIKR